MNSKLWIRKALSLCLTVAMMATYSMVTLAGSEKAAGELLVSGKNVNGQIPFVKVNGEMVQSGLSVFSSSTIATPEDASAIINLGKIGKVELAPNTTLSLTFDNKNISGDLLAGRLTVLSAADAVTVKTAEGKTVKLNAGETATSGKVQDDDDDCDDDGIPDDKDDDDDCGGGGGAFVWALILGGAIAAIIIAARTDNNNISLGSGVIVVSPTR